MGILGNTTTADLVKEFRRTGQLPPGTGPVWPPQTPDWFLADQSPQVAPEPIPPAPAGIPSAQAAPQVPEVAPPISPPVPPVAPPQSPLDAGPVQPEGISPMDFGATPPGPGGAPVEGTPFGEESGQDPMLRDSLREMIAARETARKRQLIAGLGGAADKIIAGISGQEADPDTFKGYGEQAQQPVADAKEKRSLIESYLREKAKAGYLKENLELKRRGLDIKEKGQELKAGATKENTFQKKLASKRAETVAEWEEKGRAGHAEKIASLREAIKQLGTTDMASGKFVGQFGEGMRVLLPGGEAGRRAQKNMEKTVMESLRATLGAQFTAREGERILSYTFDPLMSEEENANNARGLMIKLERIAKGKDALAAYGRKFGGDFSGYGGPAYETDQEILDSLGISYGKPPGPPGSGGIQEVTAGGANYEAGINQVMQTNKVPRDEAVKALKAAGKLPGDFK